MDEQVTFRVTITGTYTCPKHLLQQFYTTSDPQEAAQLDLVTFNDDPCEGILSIEDNLEVSVKVEDPS